MKISTVLKNLTRGKSPLSMRGKAKIPQKAWRGKDCEESGIIFESGELVVGVLDKNQFGASEFSLVHVSFPHFSFVTFDCFISDTLPHPGLLRTLRP